MLARLATRSSAVAVPAVAVPALTVPGLSASTSAEMA